MYRKAESAREKRNRLVKRFDHLAKVLQMSKAMQTRFKLIPEEYLNKVTVAGVRDMNLGRVNNGKPVGRNVVRFNNPSKGTKSDFSRICIDPKGVSNKANPHIPISDGAVKAVANIQKGLKVTGKVLFVVSIVATGIRIGKAIYDEVEIDSEIKALEQIVDCLKEDLKNCTSETKAETKEALEFAESLLEDARDCKRNPGKKTVLTGLCIGGEWGGAAALGYAGAQGGAAIGAIGGPVGAIAGAVTGSVVGAIAGSELGASAVENFRCDDDGVATEMQGSLVNFGDQVKGQVLGLDGNVFVGKGLEVGARGALFQIEEKGEGKMEVGKVGANFGVTNKGVDVAVEGKLAWTEVESKNTKVGFGINVDTGIQATEKGVSASVLGFGFSAGDEGVGFKTPVFSFTWKS